MSDTPERPEPSARPDPPERPDFSAVPLFPLPSVVLFPRAVLPLHIFEERYKAMTADALDGPRQVAMALLKPGWEKDYYQKPPIEPVVCVGTILSHEKLPDGKYNFLLQGHARARITREVTAQGKPYRVARLEPLPDSNELEIDLEDERRRLLRLFRPTLLGATPVGRQFLSLLTGGARTADIVDLLAFNYIDDVRLKQSLLEETDVRTRARRAAEALESARTTLQLATLPEGTDPAWN
ncbi:MAG TPA: LON peptidase substrate-binding domain-containing protein [Tepidisphaeraceae bacterium]|nr:LON peptidase substrate-binding domain-containing protein [Tepidisphaeraceae bacterium]